MYTERWRWGEMSKQELHSDGAGRMRKKWYLDIRDR